MQDLTKPIGVDTEGLAAGPGRPVRFAGLDLDLAACTLKGASGEPIPLTRGEFALLRVFVSRPGRVLSRDAILSAIADRPLEPFDRSVDVLVSRLRRKIEPDPKTPQLIVTVPGEGYRFDGKPRLALPQEQPEPLKASEAAPTDERAAKPERHPRNFVLALTALTVVALALAALGLWAFLGGRDAPTPGPPRVAVLPFANLSGDSAMDYLGPGLALELTSLLASFPGVTAISPPATSPGSPPDVVRSARDAKARFVLYGGVHRLPDRLRVTAQLYDGETGAAIWSDQIDTAGTDPVRVQEDIAGRIYHSVAGLDGSIRNSEQRAAWQKTPMALDEYDYYLRGLQYHLRSTVKDSLKARAIWREGLDRYPESALLKIKLGFTYLFVVMNGASADPKDDIEQAWRYLEAASEKGMLSRFEAWHAHWLKAFLHQWRDNDFTRSVAEARAAVALAPNDPLCRGDLSWVLANAGLGDEAAAWAQTAIEGSVNPPLWLHGNLGWANYVAGRYREALEASRGIEYVFAMRVAAQVRLGETEAARAAVADYVRGRGWDTIAKEARYPQIEPDRTQFLDALRMAGFPES
jgi:TolB-like protein/DNA-binding winged helix-turn-helix (wHTH) protein